ncbi:immune inhibitor A peptidase M6 [Tahibacter aquaticus]|uniref:Immune inhibitor A peptidase M6 n=1 Tax=Tahibacter aquaticus TaxID=520092 RepID=A0A4R6YWA1_9GAMM|nr:S8 family serine peptidase [Tahibacter aquaticus]TDR43041.1 immune inhibitor A peptidase M6 [Tahibacter aquaticus]
MNRHRLAAAISLAVAMQFASATTLETVRPQRTTPEALTDAVVADAGLLLLRSGAIDPQRQRIDFSATGAAADVASSRYAIAQFDPADRTARARLEKQGYRVVAYIPNRAYVVELKAQGTLERLQSSAQVRWAGIFQPGMKLDPNLFLENRAELAKSPYGGYEVQVFGFAGTSARQIAETLRKSADASPVVVSEHDSLPTVRVRVAEQNLSRLVVAATAMEGVSFVGQYVQPYLDNSASIGAVQGNNTNNAGAGSGAPTAPSPMFDHNLFGSGQIVALSDSGVDANEAWFTTLDKGAGPVTAIPTPASPLPPAVLPPNPTNKIINYWIQPGATANDNNNTCPGSPSSTSWHGTHVAGTIAGDAAGTFGASNYLASTPTALNHELADGMAPNAQLLVQDIGNDTSGCLAGGAVNDMFSQTTGGGAFIHSSSWGAPTAAAYSANDVSADQGLRDNEGLLFVVSAGNSGPAVGSTGTPGNAKNALTVGMLGHAGSLAINFQSSRGPTDDGRIKPDITAPGTSIVSAAGDSSTTANPEAPATKALTGTSMAAPTVSGSAALMRQFFTEGFYPRGAKTAADQFIPGGMVMKATLLNGTNPIAAGFGGNDTGWGRAWLDGNLYFSTTLAGGDDSRRLRLFERTQLAGMRTGEVQEYTIANVAAGQELRATLTWYDVPGTPGAAIALVNNLDLEVVGPGGTYLGNVLAAGASITGGVADVRNTVEQVRLSAPTAGSYTFRVKATNVPGDGSANSTRQGYALAVSGNFGLPAAAAHPAPTATTATTVGNTSSVAFTGAAGAQSYQLYRATGTCATAAAGNFHLVGTGAASPLIDTTAQGGYSYAYTIRGVAGDVEGDVSNCIDLTSTAACTLQPQFDTDSFAIGSTEGSNCHIALGWQAGSSNCPASSMEYKVERDTSLAFAAPVTLAAANPGITFDDTTPNPGTAYFYRVEGRDAAGNSGGFSAVLGTTPVGPNGVSSDDYADNGDSSIYLLSESPWHLSTLNPSPGGGRNYFMGNESGTYGGDLCSSVTTPSIAVQAGASTLNFNARYDIEHRWDGAVMEISTDNGTTWADLPPDGGYPSSFADTQGNGCGFPNTRGAFNGVTTATSNADPGNGTAVAVWKPFTRNLSAYVGQSIKLRWRFSSDSAAEFQGFFLDDVNLGGTVVDRLFKNGFESGQVSSCN